MTKNGFDYFFAVIVTILVLLWLVPLISLIIFITTRENPFYTQARIGKNGIVFNLYKFRTMIGKPPTNDPLLSKDESSRITMIGRIFRKYRIDEFPQFINVLRGEMSIVGPRPERQYFSNKMIAEIPRYKELQKLKPGITSVGQVKFGYADSFEEMVKRARYDLLYLENLSLCMDIKLIMATVIVVFKGKGK